MEVMCALESMGEMSVEFGFWGKAVLCVLYGFQIWGSAVWFADVWMMGRGMGYGISG